jgi:ABC-type multidrug transport system fused ATPase/permease subunit
VSEWTDASPWLAVGLHDTIAALPEGYETTLGSGGALLGPEDLTRLALARAVLVDPALLTVDDIYSQVPESVEPGLRAAVRSALPGRTIVVATSRMSICEDADLVLVMRDGEVVEAGTHESLMAGAGVYRRMYGRQMGLAVD